MSELITIDTVPVTQNVVPCHRSDQLSHIGINSRATTLVWARFPDPVQLKSFLMPSDQCIRLEDLQCLQELGPQTIEPNPKNTFALLKAESFPITVGDQRQLLTQSKHLELKRSSTPQEIHQGCEERDNYCFHTGNATCHRSEKSRKSTCTEFLVGPGRLACLAR